MKDFLGNEIKVGSTVLYAITKSRSACLVLAEVMEVYEENVGDWSKSKLKVQPLKDSYGHRWSGTKWDKDLKKHVADGLPKPVYLPKIDRIAVVSDELRNGLEEA